MNSLNKIVQSMYGSRRLEETASLADMDTQTYIGIATGDSEEGSVSVWLTDDVTQSDNGIWDGGTWVPADESDTSVVLPTTQSVHKGDRVLVSMFGGNTIATPVVTGVIGGGDSIRQDVDVAQTSATSAEEVANAVNQHFWPDTDGIHVTEVTQEEWQDSTGTSYHSGQNVLINALGQLFRKGLTHLMALTAGEDETATFTVSETVRDYTLPSGVSVVGKPSITVNGVEPAWDEWEWYPPRTIRYRSYYDHDGEEMVVTYRRSSALSIFNGLGNAAENVMAFFDSRGMTLLDGLGYIGGYTTTYIGEERMDNGGHVIGYNMQDAHSLQFANSSPTVTNALAYMNITASENYQVDTEGSRTGTSTWSPTMSTYVSNGTNSSGISIYPDSVFLSTPTLEVYDRSEYTVYGWSSHEVTQALNCRSSGVLTMWAGSKVMNVGTDVSTFTLFTKAQLQAIVGTDWTPTVNNCAVFVMNGDYTVTDAMMSASINSSSVVRVHMNKTRTGNLRVNYLIVRIGG